jgi:hypothetical protein
VADYQTDFNIHAYFMAVITGRQDSGVNEIQLKPYQSLRTAL